MGLKRTLSLSELIVYGVGSMIGAGIYSIIGSAAVLTKNNLWISFLLASIAAFITVLSYAELSSMYPRAGAEFQFLKHAFPKWPYFSFMAGFLIALNASATSATVALAFANYLQTFIINKEIFTAFLLLLSCTVVNISGIKQSTWANIILLTIEVGGLLLIIWSGLGKIDFNKIFQGISSIDSKVFSNLLNATALIFFVYIGFEDVANLSEETKKPLQTIPKALIYSVVITSIIYILVTLSFIFLAEKNVIHTDSPLSNAVATISPLRAKLVAIAALFATTSTALISLVSISRMLYGMANEGAMPKIFSSTLSRRKTPWVSALFLFAWASLLLLLGNIPSVASVSSMGVLLVFLAVQIAVIRLRFTEKNLPRQFRIPFNIKNIPILPIVGIFIILSLLTKFQETIYGIVGLTILTGSLLYFFIPTKK